ncbi:MAG TPA: NAD(P)-dependent oxidoreductase [Dehalococcoidales bacterium]|nr:NAD(P)-dependent oxidoreductase [Dehalococcoidales bacterium]
MTVLVTGGTGFIGSRVVRDLVKIGQDVVAFDWAPEPIMLTRLIKLEEISQKVKIVQGDVNNFAHLISTLKNHNIDTVVHCAALLLHDVNTNPLLGIKVNCEGTVAVFEAARLLGLKKVVWISSGSVFGPPEAYAEEYIPNDAPHYPQNLYGGTKSLDEQFAAFYAERYDLDITAIRLVLVYGAWQTRGRTAAIIREMVANPALGKPGKVPAARDNVLGWTYVDDAARAIVLAVQSGRTKTRSFSVRGNIHSVGEIVDYVETLLPGSQITMLALEKSKSHLIMTCKYDMSRIEEELGFHLQWSMQHGIRETINLIRRENGLPAI